MGAKHLMADMNWKDQVIEAAYNGKLQISVTLDGVEGLNGVIMRGKFAEVGVYAANVGGRNPSPFDWEMYIVVQGHLLQGWRRRTEPFHELAGSGRMTQQHPYGEMRLPLVYDRPFAVDGVASPHQQLLLKSPMGDVHQERIDVSFRAVDAVSLIFTMTVMEIRTPTGRDVDNGVRIFGEWVKGAHDKGEVFSVVTGDCRGLVVASAAYLSINELHGANPSPLRGELDVALRAGPVFRLVHEP